MARRARQIGWEQNRAGVLATNGVRATLMANSALKMLAHRGVEELGPELSSSGGP